MGQRKPGHIGELGKSGVMAACLQTLDVYRIWYMRTNTGTMKLSDANGKTRLFRAGRKGMADIFATPWTTEPYEQEILCTWIECKSSIGTQSDDQRAFQAEVEMHGHYYFLINDPQELLDWIKYRKLAGSPSSDSLEPTRIK